MKLLTSLLALTFLATAVYAQENNGITNEPKLGARKIGVPQPIFNGKDLDGWKGNTELWSVKDGAITGKTSAENPAKHNTFLVWTGGTVENFELTFKYKIVANNDKGFANSGVQYRSRVNQPGENGPIVSGYQADFEFGKVYSGILYEEKGRGILAKRGEKTVVKADPADPNKAKVEVVGKVGDAEAIQASIHNDQWNDYRIVAQGNHVQHFINGQQTVDVTDEQTAKAPTE